MKHLVDTQRLGVVATVGSSGESNLSPEETIAVWDEKTLVFADIDSTGVAQDLLENPACEIKVVDAAGRRGFRFRGSARLLLSGPTFDRLLDFYRQRGTMDAVRHFVLVRVEGADEDFD